MEQQIERLQEELGEISEDLDYEREMRKKAQLDLAKLKATM